MQPLSLSSNVYRLSLVAKPIFYSANSYETWEYNQTLPVPEQDYTTLNLESSYFSFRSLQLVLVVFSTISKPAETMIASPKKRLPVRLGNASPVVKACYLES